MTLAGCFASTTVDAPVDVGCVAEPMGAVAEEFVAGATAPVTDEEADVDDGGARGANIRSGRPRLVCCSLDGAGLEDGAGASKPLPADFDFADDQALIY